MVQFLNSLPSHAPVFRTRNPSVSYRICVHVAEASGFSCIVRANVCPVSRIHSPSHVPPRCTPMLAPAFLAIVFNARFVPRTPAVDGELGRMSRSMVAKSTHTVSFFLPSFFFLYPFHDEKGSKAGTRRERDTMQEQAPTGLRQEKPYSRIVPPTT